MIKIIEPKQFKLIPWKNGLGETTELAINDGGNLDDFTWRLSIASVVNDGVFSDFSGYQRNLVLIEGHGISLQYDDENTDVLEKVLDIASFDGGCKTHGKLVAGAIKDFNIITDINKISADVHCYIEDQQVVIELSKSSLCFAYSLSDEMLLETSQQESTVVPVGSLAKISAINDKLKTSEVSVNITGKNMVIVQLEMKKLKNNLPVNQS